MIDLPSKLPARRTELVIRPLGHNGQHVVKDPHTGEFYHLGPQEHFLLMQLDGAQDAAAVRAAFEGEFGEPLREEELDEFIELSQEQNLLQDPHATAHHAGPGVPKRVAHSAPRAPAKASSIGANAS